MPIIANKIKPLNFTNTMQIENNIVFGAAAVGIAFLIGYAVWYKNKER
jgi:hypothetical protein